MHIVPEERNFPTNIGNSVREKNPILLFRLIMEVKWVYSNGLKPEENLREEEELFTATEQDGRVRVRFWRNQSSAILGRNLEPEKFVFLDYCRWKHIPVLHRMSGGGAVYHDEGNLNYSLFLPVKYLNALRLTRWSFSSQFAYFTEIPVNALSLLEISAERREISSLFISGKKISGSAMKMGRETLLFHGTMLVFTDTGEMERVLKVPPGVTYCRHQDFVTTLHQMGFLLKMDDVQEALKKAFEIFLHQIFEVKES